MEQIHTAVFCTCCTALALSLAEGLLPFARFEKQLRLIFSLILMTAMLKPLTKIQFPAVSERQAEAAAYAEEIAEQAALAREQAAAESVRNALNRTLAEQNVPCKVTAVRLHILNDGSIDICEVIISGNLLTGRVCLRELLGSGVTVTEGGEAHAEAD